MSKSTSPRAVDSIDWVALLAAVNDERSITPEARELWLQGKWSDPRPSWGRDYLGALQQALARRDISQLLAMLDAAVPLPDCLLPAMAIVLRDLKAGYATCAPARLTALDDEVIR